MLTTTETISTAIGTISYFSLAKWLDITFNRGVRYRYHNVPNIRFRELIDAESVGKYYNQHIRNEYRCEKCD